MKNGRVVVNEALNHRHVLDIGMVEEVNNVAYKPMLIQGRQLRF